MSVEEGDLIWRSTDWTAWQRSGAIGGALALTLGYVLLAGALALWRIAPLASTTVAPIATTLVCLGVALLNTIYWLPYRLALHLIGDQPRQVRLLIRLMLLEALVALGVLALQLLAALLIAITGSATWADYLPHSYLVPVVVAVVANGVSLVSAGGIFNGRPLRDQVAPRSVLGPPVRGVRRLIRWVVMGVGANGLVLVGAAAFVTFTGYGDLAHGSPDTLPRVQIAALFGIAAAFFLLAALSELTHRA